MISIFQQFAATCGGGSFLGFPKWHKYLQGNEDTATGACTPVLRNINDVWLIGAAVLEILLRVAALMAVIFVLYAGISYITSQGEPEKVQNAKRTLLSAIIGLVIAIVATAVVSFIAGRFTASP